MELEKIIEEKMVEINASGFIEAQVKKRLEETISYVISNSLAPYSDFGKGITEKVNKTLELGSIEFDLPSYNRLVCNWVTDIVNKTLIESGKKQIEDNLKTFFAPLEKDTYTLTEIIEKFKKSIGENEEGEETVDISFHKMTDGDFTHFYFDKEADKAKYYCDYHIGVCKDTVFSMSIEGVDASKMKSPFLVGFDSFLFQLFALRAKITDETEAQW